MFPRAVGALMVIMLICGFLCAGDYSGAVYRYEPDDGVVTLLIPNDGKLVKQYAKIDKDSKLTKDGKAVTVKEFAKMVKAAANPKDKGLKVKVATKKATTAGGYEIATKIEIVKTMKENKKD
jgi:hypothetical protein